MRLHYEATCRHGALLDKPCPECDAEFQEQEAQRPAGGSPGLQGLAEEIASLVSNRPERLADRFAERLRIHFGYQDQALTAALAREAGLRGELEKAQEHLDAAEGHLTRLAMSPVVSGMSARIRDEAKERGVKDPYRSAVDFLTAQVVAGEDPTNSLRDRPQLSQAAAEVLEAAEEERLAEIRESEHFLRTGRRKGDEGLRKATMEASFGRREAMDRYLALRRGEGEEG